MLSFEATQTGRKVMCRRKQRPKISQRRVWVRVPRAACAEAELDASVIDMEDDKAGASPKAGEGSQGLQYS